MLWLYNILSFIALIIYFPFLITKKGPEDRIVFIKERLGMSDYTKADIWVHAVSVGETLASLPFLKRLKAEFPEKRVILSTTTYTGQKLARERFPDADRVMYVPIDTTLCVRRAAEGIRPKIFITVETELWPELFASLKQNGASTMVLNGRISKESFKGYSRISFLMQGLFKHIDYLYMQSKGDAERILKLGAEQRRVGVMGNFKFDFNIDVSEGYEWLNCARGDLFLAASTHRGEDEIVIDAFLRAREERNNLKLIIAPRHPERFDEVARLISQKGLQMLRRSEINDQTHGTDDSEVILLDTIGELSGLFSKVQITFIGGSLVPVGGHNILEPAYFSKPIIFGPHMDNFPVAREFLDREAAIQINNSHDMAETINAIIKDPERSTIMGDNAKKIVNENAGAVQNAVELVRKYIGTV